MDDLLVHRCVMAADACSACRHKALLGLIDDVDCAVVSLTACLSAPAEALTHVATVPAFAYVTTGIGKSWVSSLAWDTESSAPLR